MRVTDDDGRTVDGILPVAFAGGNVATGYGNTVASSPRDPMWSVSPEDGNAMPGSNLCGNESCLVTAIDSFDNTVLTPTIVQIRAVDMTELRPVLAVGPAFVLLQNGTSPAIDDIRLRALLVPDGTTVMTESLSIRVSLLLPEGGDSAGGGVQLSSLTPCSAGFGAESDGEGLVCLPCAAGTYSEATSWEGCLPCPAGTTTGGLGDTECAWCIPGWGWDEAAGSCVACAAGTFAANATLQAPCDVCGSGLTTSGDGADACAVAIAQPTPFWVWIIGGVAVVALVACVGVCAWRKSRLAVITSYYIGTDASCQPPFLFYF